MEDLIRHFRRLAHYNRLTNARLYGACARLSEAERKKTRPAFFGSIHGTLNHILLGDRIWLARFEGESAPSTGLDTILYEDFGELQAARGAEDARLEAFAAGLTPEVLQGSIRYVNNAGLVMLWPFLERLFEYAELVKDGRFVTNTARHRAVALLECAATGQPQADEYRTPLSKVLCGLTPEQVLEPGSPLQADETRTVDECLTAVVAQAPILRDMSPDGLRGTFLLREGALSVRDGLWLLRVERQTYDVVLDRVPWPLSVVKLPWMSGPCQVEW